MSNIENDSKVENSYVDVDDVSSVVIVVVGVGVGVIVFFIIIFIFESFFVVVGVFGFILEDVIVVGFVEEFIEGFDISGWGDVRGIFDVFERGKFNIKKDC